MSKKGGIPWQLPPEKFAEWIKARNKKAAEARVRRAERLPEITKQKEAKLYRKKRKTMQYCETMCRGRYVCKICKTTFKRTATCPTCNTEMLYYGPRFKAPGKNASKRKWDDFFARVEAGGHTCR